MSNEKDVGMLGLCNEFFYLDVDELEKFLILKNESKVIVSKNITKHYDSEDKLISKTVISEEQERGKQYDTVKYEMIRYLFDSLSLEINDLDTTMGLEKAMENISLPSKLAFNTLAGYGILKKY